MKIRTDFFPHFFFSHPYRSVKPAASPASADNLDMSSPRFENDCLRDPLIIALINSLTSLLSGFVIFSVVGYMAKVLNLPIGKTFKYTLYIPLDNLINPLFHNSVLFFLIRHACSIVCGVHGSFHGINSLISFLPLLGEVIRSGPGLVFVVYPEVITQLPGAPVW